MNVEWSGKRKVVYIAMLIIWIMGMLIFPIMGIKSLVK
jgi:hypothetical protein